MTAGQGGYASHNRFTGLSPVDEVLEDGTAKMIARRLTLHIANLLAQTTTSIEANATHDINASLQQLVLNNAQLHQQ
jgi:hypothetical protein